MTSSSVTPLAASFPWLDLTWYALMRSPQMAMLATPGTRSSRARIFQ